MGGFQNMLSQVTGDTSTPSPSTPPPTAPPATPIAPSPTLTANGADLPPQTATAAPMPPEAENASFQQMLSQVTGQTGDSNSNEATPPPDKGGFVKGVGESTGLDSIVPAAKAAMASDQQKNERALDIYHQMIAAHAKGDNVGATEAASKFLLTAARQGLSKSYAPFIDAAKMVILDPIKSVQDTRAKMREAGAGNLAAGAANEAKTVWNNAKQDWETGNHVGAVTDVAAGLADNAGAGVIPLAGPVVKSTLDNANAATHAPGGPDYLRLAGQAVGTAGAMLLGEGVGKLGELFPAGRGAAGLLEGQGGADAARTAADTAAEHDRILQANKDNFQTQLNQATQKADATKAKATEANKANTTETGNQNVERRAAHEDLITKGRDAQHAAIDETLDKAKQQYANDFKTSLTSNVTPETLAPEELADKVNKGINQYEQKAHTDYEGGLTGGNPKAPTPDSVIGQLAGKTEPVVGSPFQEMAKERLARPDPEDHPYASDATDLAKAGIDSKLEAKLDNWSKGVQDVETNGPADAAGNPTKIMVKKDVAAFTAPDLIKLRQTLRKAAEGFPRGNINRNIYGDMINATDKTLEKMAGTNPDVISKYEGMRKQYKTAQSNLNTQTANKLRLDAPDQALGDVNKYLLSGNNAAARVKTISSILGEETMGGLRQSYLAQLAEMTPEEAQEALGKIPADVRQAFFGPELDGRLQASQSLYDKSVQSAEQEAAAQKEYASSAADQALDKQGVQARYDRQANSAAAQAQSAKIASDYQDAVNAAKAAHATQSAPYSTKFANAISDGSVGDKLATDSKGRGGFAVEDVDALKQALDPADFAKIQEGIVNRQMAASLTNGHFNSVKFLDWYDRIPAPTRDAFFSDASGQPMTIDISGIRDAAKLQQLARAGTLVSGGLALKLAPGSALKGLFEVAAGVAGATRAELFTNLLDTVATQPRFLNLLADVAPTVKKAAAVTRGATRMGTAMQAVTVAGHPGTIVGTHPESGKPVVMYH